MIAGSKLLQVVSTMCFLSASLAFVTKVGPSTIITSRRVSACRLFSSSSSTVGVENSVSRISTFQSMITKYGIPGSTGCSLADDLEPVLSPSQDAPELVASMTAPEDDELSNLHPYLYPIAKSKSTGNLVCAYRNAYTDEGEANSKTPWPIVEATLGGPGMQLLALNSEHLMRRIACEKDFAGDGEEAVTLYNDGLGEGRMADAALDAPYIPGDVEKLGYV